MNDFIAANPAVVMSFVGALFVVIGLLFSAVTYLGKRSVDNLISAIKSLEAALGIDRADIGTLKDRMQAQETHCKTTHQYCKWARGATA